MGRETIVITVGKDWVVREDLIDEMRDLVTLKECLVCAGYKPEIVLLRKTDFSDKSLLRQKILEHKPFCILNFFEGFVDDSKKEAEFAKVLEEMNIPFTGNGSETLHLCLNKFQLKQKCQTVSIPFPKGIFVQTMEQLVLKDIKFPVFVKPNQEDASLGIDKDSLVSDQKDLSRVVSKKIHDFPGGVLVEEFISGKEYNASWLGEYPYELVGISVMDYSLCNEYSPFLTYRAKWDKRSLDYKHLIPAVCENIDAHIKARITELSKKLGQHLGCKGYFRVDFREVDGRLYVLDVNPNPDITEQSGFWQQAKCKGYTYQDLITKIISFAVKPPSEIQEQKTHT